MGGMKQILAEQESQGFISVDEKRVCHSCFQNRSLSAFIKAYASDDRCDYCGREAETAISMDINEVIERIFVSLSRLYRDPVGLGLPIHDDDLDWDGNILDSHDMVYFEADLGTDNEDILNDIVKAFRDRIWLRPGALYPTESESLTMSWYNFSHIVTSEWRYTYFLAKADTHEPSTYDPLTTINSIFKIAREHGLITKIKKNSLLFRARLHKKAEEPTKATELGTPESRHVRRANRLSPVGVPLF